MIDTHASSSALADAWSLSAEVSAPVPPAPRARASAFDPRLVARYDVNAPRYTSYPTAPHFRATFGERHLVRALRASNDGGRDLSLYVHVPYCLSPCFYCGCTRVVTRDRRKGEAYLESLRREIALVGRRIDPGRRVTQIHFGGGTPNFLDTAQLLGLVDVMRAAFTLEEGDAREFGIEIDPRHCSEAIARRLAEGGFNRFSLGVQDLDPAVQRAINRVQSLEQTADVMRGARAGGARSINVDLIYGLPLQTPRAYAHTLAQVVALAPDRIAAYGYAHLPDRFPAQRQIDKHALPDAAARLELLRMTVETLVGAGYVHIGVDHFARPGDDLARALADGSLRRNFQGYSTQAATDLVGLGLSAISHVGTTYSQNTKDPDQYASALEAGHLPAVRGLRLGADDRVRADAIERLMCAGVIDIAAFSATHQIEFRPYFHDAISALRPLADDGLVRIDDARIAVTARGRFLLRNIAHCFDAYAGDARVRYSRAL